MHLRIRYFAALREALGPGETLDLPEGLSVAQVRERLAAQDAAHAAVLSPGKAVRAALDQVMCDDERATPVTDGAELAFFPPVTGG